MLPPPGADDIKPTASGGQSSIWCRCVLREGRRLPAIAGRTIEAGTLTRSGRRGDRDRACSPRGSGERRVARRSEAVRAAGFARPRLRTPLTDSCGQQPSGAWLTDVDGASRVNSCSPRSSADAAVPEHSDGDRRRHHRRGCPVAHPRRSSAARGAGEHRSPPSGRRHAPERLVRLDPATAAALTSGLENAAQHAPGASTIDVATTTAEGLTTVRSGPGVAPVDVRTCSSVSIAAPGETAGLRHGPVDRAGLLVVEHGRISAEKGRDGGARPRRRRRGMSRAARILLVDDEVSIQRAVALLLRSRGYDVTSPALALGTQTGREHPPDPSPDPARLIRWTKSAGGSGTLEGADHLPARGAEQDKVAALDPARTTTSRNRSARGAVSRLIPSRCGRSRRRSRGRAHAGRRSDG